MPNISLILAQMKGHWKNIDQVGLQEAPHFSKNYPKKHYFLLSKTLLHYTKSSKGSFYSSK